MARFVNPPTSLDVRCWSDSCGRLQKTHYLTSNIEHKKCMWTIRNVSCNLHILSRWLTKNSWMFKHFSSIKRIFLFYYWKNSSKVHYFLQYTYTHIGLYYRLSIKCKKLVLRYFSITHLLVTYHYFILLSLFTLWNFDQHLF